MFLKLNSDTGSYKWVLLFLLILSAATFLRAWPATQLPLWLDEALTWRDAQWPWPRYLDWSHNPLHAPLSYIFVRGFLSVFDHNELVLRLPSLIFGVLNVALAYLLARSVTTSFVALVFSAFIATDPLLVITDAYARMYSMWLFSIFLCLMAYLALRNQLHAGENGRPGSWAIMGLVLAISLWIHPLSVYVWAALGLALIIDSGTLGPGNSSFASIATRWKGLVVALIVTIILSVPGILKIIRMLTPAEDKPNEGVIHIERAGLLETLGNFAFTSAYPLLYALSILGLFLLSKKDRAFARVLVFLVLFGVITLLAGSSSHHPNAHYLYPLVIPVYLGVAVALVSIATWFTEKGLKYFAMATIALCLLMPAYRAYQSLGRAQAYINSVRGPYEGSMLMQYVAARARETDILILMPPWLIERARFYGVGAQVPNLQRNSRKWLDGFGYDIDRIELNKNTIIWIALETRYAKNEFRPLAKNDLRKLYLRSTGGLPSDRELKRLLESNVIRFSQGQAKTWTSEQVASLTHGLEQRAIVSLNSK